MGKPREPVVRRLRALIVDDEPLARDGLRHLIRKESDIVVVGECPDGVSAIEKITRQKPDILFLDIQMPEVDGFEVLRTVGATVVPAVVFVTAHDAHALRAFEVHATDYLLKPVDPDRFRESLDRVRHLFLHGGRKLAASEARQRAALLSDVDVGQTHPDRLLLRTPRHVIVIQTDWIDWVGASGDYVVYHVRGRKHLVRGKISEIEKRLDASHFVRIHRSTIVNIDRVRHLEPRPHGDQTVVLTDDTRLVLSRGYRDSAYRRMGPFV